ncbi:MAG: 50S ribosomal protein L23 [Candidatus Borkfalkiaceae bacterium]|nr:50S ribosomal protein L23 [bacterium]MDY2851293.1 50S ribosomal protein L23 [Christensenellaceae bacterium]
MREHDVIIRPLLTEKSYAGTASKKYTFVVAKKANKTEIKLAVEKLFDVQVESVNTANVRGKLKRMGRNEGMTPGYKKAIVQLKADSKPIAFFESLS